MRPHSKIPRQQLLVYLPDSLRMAVRQIALDRGTTASAIVREAIAQWLKRQGVAVP